MSLTKNNFRMQCLKKMKNAPRATKKYRDNLLNQKLFREIKKYKNKKILFYYPMDNEADIRKTLFSMRKIADVYLPFMEGESFKMVPFRLPLTRKQFGIFEAGNTLKKLNKIDIAIVPVVGVDGRFQRVGFGKGMYDRFFAKLKKRPYTLFVQQQFCYTKDSVCDVYDIKCDLYLTPYRQIKNVAYHMGK